jgi:hypothetical protein
MYIHDKKSGLILPLPLYLVWKYKVPILIFGVIAQAIVPILFLAVPKSQQPSMNVESPFVAFHNRCVRDGIEPSICQLRYPIEASK